MDILNTMKKFWKGITCVAVLAVVTGGYLAYAAADDSPAVSISDPKINQSSDYYIDGDGAYTTTLVGKFSGGIDLPAGSTVTQDDLLDSNLVWSVDNNQAITFLDSNGDPYGANAVVRGKNVTITSANAGRAYVTAVYYYNPNDLSALYQPGVNDADFVTSEQAQLLMPYTVKIDVKTYNDVPIKKVYIPGNEIQFSVNSAPNDPIAVDITNSDVASFTRSTGYQSGKLTVKNGGKTNVFVRVESGRALQDNGTLGDYVDGLYERYVITGKVLFDSQYEKAVTPAGKSIKVFEMGTDSTYGTQKIASNIVENAGVDYDYAGGGQSVATMVNGYVVPNGAGVALITAGVRDEDDASGAFLSFTDTDGTTVDSSDSIYVRIPLMWMDNSTAKRELGTISMAIGDQYPLSVNASEGVTFLSNDRSVVTVDENTGLIHAVGNGSATITAYIKDTAHADSYLDFEDTITMNVVVGDSLTLSPNVYNVNVGEKFDINAVSSSTNPVTFRIDGTLIEKPQGTEGSKTTTVGGLEAEILSTDTTVLHLTALTEGDYRVVATQEVDGLIKTSTSVVHVNTYTPVTGIHLTDKELSIELITVDGVDMTRTQTLEAIVEPTTANNQEVIWVSSDTDLLTISDLGNNKVELIPNSNGNGGTVVVTAITVDGQYKAYCTVKLVKKSEGLVLSETDVDIDLNVTKTYQLGYTVLPVNATDTNDGITRKVIWSSTDESVLTVDSDGKVTFLQSGTAAVIAQTSDGANVASCMFHVNVPVESVKINHDDIEELYVGDDPVQLGLYKEIYPDNTTSKDVIWTSSNPDVASVDVNGNVRALRPGDTVITCTSAANKTLSDSIHVHVIQSVTGVTLTVHEITVKRGDYFWLYAEVTPTTAERKTITWTSSDTTVATVDENGKVTTLKPGTTTIKATNVETNEYDSCEVTVTNPVTGISFKNGDSETLFVGAKVAILPEVEPTDAVDKTVTYLSTDESVATVDSNGIVTALKGGYCEIVVTTKEGQLTATYKVTVIEYLSTITLDKDFDYINIGNQKKLIATTTAPTATNKKVVWTSSDPDIASVDQYGNVDAKKIGTTIITAAADDGGGSVATCVIQVVEPVTEISLGDSELHMAQGDTKIISVSVSPSGATVKALKWETNNAAVATVDEDGEVTAVSGGKAKITATSTDGNNVTATCTVYVTSTANATAMTLTPSTANMKVGETRTLTARTTPTSITESIAWLTSDPTVVMVDGSGKITAIGEGTAEITAYGKVSGVQAVCKVTVESAAVKATSIRLNTDQMIMLPGRTQAIQYRLLPTNSVERINWISSDVTVATVDSDGRVTTVGPGQCQIIAQTAVGGLETVCTVYSMALSKTSMTLQQYDPFTLYVDGVPDGASISWRTGNARIATVSTSGEIVGRKAGTTTITATIEDKTLTCIVQIVDATKY